MAVKRLTDVLLGSIVTLVTAPLGVGTVVGGWLGGRHAETLTGGALSGDSSSDDLDIDIRDARTPGADNE